MDTFSNDDVVLRHDWPVRIFHWCLAFSFLPAGLTGMLLFLRPFGGMEMHRVMQIHIVTAVFLTAACLLFLCLQPQRVVAFLQSIFHWTKNDWLWMKCAGGYPQKILLGREVPVPPMGKINPGQKMMGLLVVFVTPVVLATGLLLYVSLPMIPKQLAWYADILHLVAGGGLFLSVCGGHIPLAMYNWSEFLCMFGNGTMKVQAALHHHPLWVRNEIERRPD